MSQYFLKSNIKLEPLIERWYPYPLLMAPAPAALMTRHQLELMDSFVKESMRLNPFAFRASSFPAFSDATDEGQ